MKKEIENLLGAKVFIYYVNGSYYCLSNDLQSKIVADDILNSQFKNYTDMIKMGKETQWALGDNSKNILRNAYSYLLKKAEELENSERIKKYGNSIATKSCTNKYVQYLSELGEDNIKEIKKQFDNYNEVEKFLIQVYGENFIEK